MIFSRGRGSAGRSGRHSRETGRGGRHARGGRDLDDTEPRYDGAPERAAQPDPPPFGPYDVTQAPDDGVDRIDLGSLRIPALDGVEIRLQAGPQGEIQQVMLVHGGSGLELAAFAAPRSEGIWEDVRAELYGSLAASGAKPQEIQGQYGTELRARVKEAGGPADVRFVGVDGPRWLVRAVFRGAAALDPDRASRLAQALRGLVVNRGVEAMPVSEALPLRLPPDAAARLAMMSPAQGGTAIAPSGGAGAAGAGAGAADAGAGAAGSGSDRTAGRRPASRRRGR